MIMKFNPTPIADLYVAETKKISDERGSFMRMFCADSLKKETGIHFDIKQINYSHTAHKGTVRGMHFQKAPALESKIVRCIEGRILDVAVDLREGSKTFLKYFAAELSARNDLALVIPAGFAHGFQALEDNCKMIYLHNENYAKEHEDGLPYNDQAINIKWPLAANNLSERDLSFKPLSKDFKGIKA
jgi:dTDP-4-dehydrorhamnose 3,5-epimerase